MFYRAKICRLPLFRHFSIVIYVQRLVVSGRIDSSQTLILYVIRYLLLICTALSWCLIFFRNRLFCNSVTIRAFVFLFCRQDLHKKLILKFARRLYIYKRIVMRRYGNVKIYGCLIRGKFASRRFGKIQ